MGKLQDTITIVVFFSITFIIMNIFISSGSDYTCNTLWNKTKYTHFQFIMCQLKYIFVGLNSLKSGNILYFNNDLQNRKIITEPRY